MRGLIGLLAWAFCLCAIAVAGEAGLKQAEPKKEEPKEAPKAQPKAEPKEAPPKAEPKKAEPKAEPKEAEPKEAPKPPFLGEVTGERVYIRAGDGINYTVLSVAGRGDQVEVREKRYEWFGIPVPKTCTVWMRNDMVAVEADGKQGTMIKDRVNVRARPGLTGDILGQVEKGARVAVVDTDGDWVGIAPPPTTIAWIHSAHVRKVGEAGTPPLTKERPVAPAMARSAAAETLRKAQALYQAELAKPADKRDFDAVLEAYQKVAAQAQDPASAAAAERARQRLLRIVDLHNSLRAAREPLDQFEQKYKALEAEYKKRAEEAGKDKPEQ